MDIPFPEIRNQITLPSVDQNISGTSEVSKFLSVIYSCVLFGKKSLHAVPVHNILFATHISFKSYSADWLCSWLC